MMSPISSVSVNTSFLTSPTLSQKPWIPPTSQRALRPTIRSTSVKYSVAEARLVDVERLFSFPIFLGSFHNTVPSFSVHSERLAESTKKKLNDRGYFYANSNAGLGWTDRANREAFYRWRIIPRMLVDTNTRDLASAWQAACVLLKLMRH